MVSMDPLWRGPCPWASQPPPFLRTCSELRCGSSALERPWYCLRWRCFSLQVSETWGKEIPGRFNSPSIRKIEAAAIGSRVSLQALATTRYCADIPHRAPYSSPTIIFGFAGLRKAKTLAPAIGQRRKIDVNDSLLAWLRFQKTTIHKRWFNLWNS